MPSVQQIIARSARPYAWATSLIAAAGTPVSRSVRSSGYSSTQRAYSSYPLRCPGDELGVGQTLMDDLPRHGVGERDVAANVEAEPDVGPLSGARATRVDGHETGTVTDPTQQVMEEDRMRLASVRAPKDHEVRLFNFAVGRSSSPGSEHCRQTRHAWSVSSSVAAVDVVAAHDNARELLRNEVHLVG